MFIKGSKLGCTPYTPDVILASPKSTVSWGNWNIKQETARMRHLIWALVCSFIKWQDSSQFSTSRGFWVAWGCSETSVRDAIPWRKTDWDRDKAGSGKRPQLPNSASTKKRLGLFSPWSKGSQTQICPWSLVFRVWLGAFSEYKHLSRNLKSSGTINYKQLEQQSVLRQKINVCLSLNFSFPRPGPKPGVPFLPSREVCVARCQIPSRGRCHQRLSLFLTLRAPRWVTFHTFSCAWEPKI